MMRPLFLAIPVTIAIALTASNFEARADTDAGAGVIAPAPAAISADIIILHATNENSGIDPKLGKMPELSQPPFSSYNSYKLLDHVKQPLTKGQSTTIKLPTGRDLMVSWKDVIEPKKKDDLKRFVMTASIQKTGGNTFLPLLEVNAKAGEIFFVAGQNYKGGSLVIGIKVNP
jgi:hypothetical protein